MPSVGALARLSLFTALFVAPAAAADADVLPPPQPLDCDEGQVETTDHGGNHCVQRPCQTSADCPADFLCKTQNECQCDPRGEPCSCSDVSRCQPDSGTGSTSRPSRGCMCDAPGAGRAAARWPGLLCVVAAAAALAASRARQRTRRMT